MSMDVLDYFKFKKSIVSSEVNMEKFFLEFSKYHVKSPHDFLTLSKDFYSVMQTMKSSFQYTDEEQKTTFERRLRPFCLSRHRLIVPKENRLNTQSAYVNIVSEIISSKDRVLDVGGGAMPFSSILMKDYFEKVGAMDNFCISEEALNTTGICAKKGYFKTETPLQNYDAVVGSMPCTAIRSIVENCHNNNKGYIIKLCNCDLDRIAAKNNGIYRGWDEILHEVDPGVQFDHGHDYAFNVDITRDQFQKIENSAKLKDVSSLTNCVLGELTEYIQDHPTISLLENQEAFGE